MSALPPPAGATGSDHGPLLVAGLGLGAAALVAVTLAGKPPALVLGAATLGIWGAVTHRWVLQWRTLLATLVIVILFVPIGRYSLPGALPFQLEPYRVLVVLLGTVWLMCLLVQPWTRYHPTGLGGPFAAIALAMLLSVATNSENVHGLGLEAEVIKGLTFFASFFLVASLVNSTVTTRRDVDTVLKVLVGGGAVIAVLTVIESRTGFTPFNSLDRLVPILQFEGVSGTLEQRGGDHRALASAQHPIALGVLLALLLPLGTYLGRHERRRIWWICVVALGIGVITTVARTATLMLMIEVIVLLILKPRVMFRLWPWALPFLVVVHFAVPGTLGSLKSSFFPRGGLIAEQQTGAGTYGSNRLADVAPSLQEWKRSPYLGRGFGTRVTQRGDPKWNSPILDNQWLSWLLETGIAGVLALAWLFTRSIRRLGRAARRTADDEGWLLAALTASLAGFAIGMLTFDAFAFTQAIIVVFTLLGLGSAVLRLSKEAE